jgi:hypothetical protein
LTLIAITNAVILGLGLGAMLFALAVGGAQERIYAAAQAISAAADLALGVMRFGEHLARQILVDLALFAVVLVLALRSTKAWPLAAASLCVATLMTEAAQALVHATPRAYAICQATWELMADGVMAYAAWDAWRARRRARSPGGQESAGEARARCA